MKIKIIILLLLAFVISIDCNAKKRPQDEILESTTYNNVEYKIIKTWKKNAKGSYNPSYAVYANNQQILYEPYGWTRSVNLIEVEGYLFIKNNKKIYDYQGTEITSHIPYPDYVYISTFADIERPLIRFSEINGYEEYYSLDGKSLIPKHSEVTTYSSGQRKLYLIKFDLFSYGLMDENFNFIFPMNKSQEIEFIENSPLILCKQNGYTSSVYNSATNNILPYTFFKRIDNTNFFEVGISNLRGIYNSDQNSEIFPVIYESIWLDKIKDKDVVSVKKNGCYGLMSMDGKEIIPAQYHDIRFSNNNLDLAIVRLNNLSGIFDIASYAELITPSFDDLEIIDTNLIKYKLNGFWGVINLNGKEIISTTRGYTSIDYIKGLKKFTYSMYGFKGECNSYGEQLSKIAVPVNDSSHKNSSQSATRTSTANENKSVNNQAREYIETVPVQVWQPCGGCNGSGQCQVCFGSGWILNYNGGKSSCSACHGSGKCTLCAGHGGQNVVRYEQRTVYR